MTTSEDNNQLIRFRALSERGLRPISQVSARSKVPSKSQDTEGQTFISWRPSRVFSSAAKYETMKEKQITWLFNRRRQALRQTSKENLALYRRIQQVKPNIQTQIELVPLKNPRPQLTKRRFQKENTRPDDGMKKIDQAIQERSKQIVDSLTQHFGRIRRII